MIVLPSVSSGVISSSLSKIFDPKKISGLSLWLKADAGVTLGISQIIISGFTGIYAGANGTYNYDGESTWYHSVSPYYINSSGELIDDANYGVVIATNNNNFEGAWTPANYLSTITLSNAGEDLDQGVVVVNGIYTRSDATGPSGSFTGSGGRFISYDDNDGFWYTNGDYYRNYGTSLNVGDWQPEAGEEPVPTAVNSYSARNVGSPTSTTVAGSLVTAWEDQSGNGNDCSSPVSVNFNTSPYPKLYFNGVDSEITLHPDVFNGFSALSLFAVWNITDGGNQGILGSTNYSNFEIVTADGSVVRMRNNNYDSYINTGGLWNAEEFSLSTITADSAGGGSGTARRNGSTTGVNFVAANSQALQGGQTYKIGRYAENAGDYFSELYLAELIVYSQKLNGSQIDQVEGYLNDKYQIY